VVAGALILAYAIYLYLRRRRRAGSNAGSNL
jgi:hypothetical protein